MKRYGVIALIAVLVLSLAVYFAACSGGGGGGGGGTPVVSYSTSTQAASGVKSVTGAMSLSSTVGGLASGMAGAVVPPPASYGGAPTLRAKAAANTGAIANIDPRLKAVVDKMVADIKGSTIKKSIAKARSLKTASSLASSLAPTVITGTFNCGRSGTFTITATDSSTASFNENDIVVAFNACIDSASTTDYQTASGSVHFYEKYMLDNSSTTDNLGATALTLTTYASSTLVSTDVIDGTFASTYSVGTNSVETWSDSANASFSTTSPSNVKLSFNMNNISSVDVYTPGTTSDTEDYTMNGSFVFDISDSTGSLASITLAFTNLNDKWQSSNVTPFPEDEWLNGTISLTWTPSSGADCMPGALTISTAAGTPMHYATSVDSCPSSGTVVANNATVEFGKPSGYQVTVTVGGTSQVFTDCYFAGADVCISQPASISQPM